VIAEEMLAEEVLARQDHAAFVGRAELLRQGRGSCQRRDPRAASAASSGSGSG
jgi:hypothetical protein